MLVPQPQATGPTCQTSSSPPTRTGVSLLLEPEYASNTSRWASFTDRIRPRVLTSEAKARETHDIASYSGSFRFDHRDRRPSWVLQTDR